jgi:hypothetical protein
VLQDRPLHQNLPRPRHEVRQKLLRQVLLLQLTRSHLVDFHCPDRRALSKDPANGTRLFHGGKYRRIVRAGVVEDARHQGNHHRYGGESNNDREQPLHQAGVLLQKTNHALFRTFTLR